MVTWLVKISITVALIMGHERPNWAARASKWLVTAEVRAMRFGNAGEEF